MLQTLLLGFALLWQSPAAAHAGKDWGAECCSYVDPVTGVRVWELTTMGASDNLYFHFSNFTAWEGC